MHSYLSCISGTCSSPRRPCKVIVDQFDSYPETKNLTLEEIDFLFIKDGKKGLKQLTTRSQPVVESLKPASEIEEDVEKHAERRASADVDYVEGKDEKIDD